MTKAVEMDPLNASFRFELSRTLGGVLSIGSGISVVGGDSGGSSDEDKDALCKMHAGLAMELDPENERYREWFEELE